MLAYLGWSALCKFIACSRALTHDSVQDNHTWAGTHASASVMPSSDGLRRGLRPLPEDRDCRNLHILVGLRTALHS
jgi:hypothetical protein